MAQRNGVEAVAEIEGFRVIRCTPKWPGSTRVSGRGRVVDPLGRLQDLSHTDFQRPNACKMSSHA